MKQLALAILLLASSHAFAAQTNDVPCADNAADTVVDDTIGTNGTLEGGDNTDAKSVVIDSGIYTRALDLNGTDDAVAHIANGHTAGTTDSWQAWFNLDDLTTGVLFGNSGNVRIISVSSSTAIVVRSSTTLTTFTVPEMSTGASYHLLVTIAADNSTRVFLNGVESSSGAQANGGIFSWTHIGRGQSAFCNGRIWGFKSWDSDESANVAAHYAEGVTVVTVVPQLIISKHLRGRFIPLEFPKL